MQVSDTFDTIQDARNAIKTYVLDQGKSYKTVASDKKRYIIACKDKDCKFCI
jgi:hypothetical protein